jgi:geranylgeranyl diphosphate synthase type I
MVRRREVHRETVIMSPDDTGAPRSGHPTREPYDLSVALDRDTEARLNWDGFHPEARRSVLDWLARAPAGAARERRIATVVRDAARDIPTGTGRQPIRRTNTIRPTIPPAGRSAVISEPAWVRPAVASPPDALPVDAGSPSLRERVQTHLNGFLADRRAEVADISPQGVRLVDAAQSLLARGKRLRATFCYWGNQAAHGVDCEALVAASAALELLHAGALVHDDVMDHSELRRGEPTVHLQFADLHHARSWAGGSADFGTATAVLIGDLLLAWADQMLDNSGLSSHELAGARAVFDPLRTRLMTGQYLDLLEQARPPATAWDDPARALERATTVNQHKSAGYTVEQPLLMGAAIAGADTATQSTLRSYGNAVGHAFQLRDDILGVFGDPRETGKPADDDFREGKHTVLVAVAMINGSPADRTLLRTLLARHNADPADLEGFRHTLITTGALDHVESMINEHIRAATRALTEVVLPARARSALRELAVTAAQRRT